MSHFKYEIDERNIRLQLKAMEMPFSEEAWQKFENYSSTHSSLAAETSVKRFQFSLNRNVILPTVFGVVIVSFSLLLFNFVNIKDPSPANEERAEASPQVFTKEPEAPAKKEAAPQVKAEEPVPAPVVKEPVRETATPVEKVREASQATTEQDRVAIPETSPVKETPSVGIRITKSRDSVMENGEVQTIKTEIPTKKRNKKRSAVIIEPAAGEDEQAPPPAEESAPAE
jgi:hypothetical protein